MSKTPFITGLGGFALGCLALYLYQRAHQEVAPVAPPAPVIAAKPAHVDPVVPPPALPEPKPIELLPGKPTVSFATVVGGGDSADQKALLAMVGKSMKDQEAKRLALRVEERLASLKARLGLSDAQLAKIRPLVDRMLQAASPVSIGEDGGITLNADNTQEDQQKTAAEKAQAEQELLETLDPQQLAAYQDWKRDEKANRAEAKANQELASLQSQLSLSPEQKDAAFAAFTKLASEQGEETNILSNPQGFVESRNAKMEAMRPILTPEQMAVYERSAGSNIMSFSVGGPGLDATVIQEVSDHELAPNPAK